ncbi:uncharacterized protein LOC128043076 [Gossypium raimondii]|uniref:uncharacterized protein LOC128043076 n=1 Tax=Gossypium raimondii TaxID=29730 RepID=UPI00227B48BA|nr:uncharacterized protein LOC128043076 [Gossypium raimondii]
MSRESGIQIAPKVVIQKPVSFPYKDSKKVPWNYNCNVTIPGEESLVNASGEDEDFYTRSGKRYDLVNARVESGKGKALAVELGKVKTDKIEPRINQPVTENEANEFLKFLKHSEYSVVEQLHKQPTRISMLELILSSEIHRNALIKVLNETYVADDISVNKLDRLVNNISADNFIFFNDDEIPPGGRGTTKALHVSTYCGKHMLSRVLIDNGSTLNVLPLSTLNRLPVDSSHMKSCQNIVRAFDGAVPSSLHQKLKLVTEGRLITIDAEEDIIASVTSDAPYLGVDDDAVECSFRSLEFVNATFVTEGKKIPMPSISRATRMGLQMTVGKRVVPERGLGRCLQGKIEAPVVKDKQDRFGLGFKPNVKQRKKELEKRQDRRKARLNGKEVDWEPMAFPHISRTFISGGTMYSGLRTPRKKTAEEMSQDINDMSDSTMDLENPFERDMCLEESQDFEDNTDYNLPPDLLRMVEQEEKQVLPHEETIETVILEEGKVVKIGTCIAEEVKQDLVKLLREFKDVFAWSYQDMPGLSTDIVVHRLPIKEDYKPVQQKLRRMRPDVVLKIKEEVQKQFDAGFLQVVKYSEWVANIVPVPKKDGKVRMCVDYRDLNKASPKDNFPLPHIDALVDNTAGHSLFSFMDGATYQRAMVTLFHDMMYNELEVYVDDMIAKSKTEEEHVQVLKKLFMRLRKFQLKLNLAKCTFGVRSGKLLGFVVSEKGIEIDPDKVRAIQELPPPRTQKEVRGFLERLNYIARFISQLTEKCDPIFRLLKKHNPSVWDEECQKTFDKVKHYLSNAPVLMPPCPDKPLILYLAVFENSMGCVLGQHDESGRKERAIYYLIYVNQKAVKGSAIAEFLASRALDDYEPLNFDFPNEDLMYIATVEKDFQEGGPWKLSFDELQML